MKGCTERSGEGTVIHTADGTVCAVSGQSLHPVLHAEATGAHHCANFQDGGCKVYGTCEVSLYHPTITVVSNDTLISKE